MTDKEDARNAKWEAIALELGRLVIGWSKVEFYIMRAFIGLAELPEEAAAVLAKRIRGSGMQEASMGLLGKLEAADAAAVREWLRSCQAVREERNRIFHGHLVNRSDGETWHPTAIEYVLDKASGKAVLAHSQLSVEELRDVNSRVSKLAKTYTKLPEIVREGITVGD